MIARVALALACVIVSILLFAATRPDTFLIRRSLLISAPSEKIFDLINDFHRWPQWAPQDIEDASMKRTYSGAVCGTGAISEWSGRGSTGSGRMEIIESRAPATIKIRTTFVKPFKANNLNEFTLEAEGTGTRITWSMQGSNLYFMKIMGLFTNMDGLLGKHFDAGLRNLKRLAETK